MGEEQRILESLDNPEFRSLLEGRVTSLSTTRYIITSPIDKRYNCIAWAASDTRRWWQPGRYWLADWPQDPSVEAFEAAFATLGYVVCENDVHEPGFEKIAIYSQDGAVAHMARQLPDGNWTSKLGSLQDITHGTPHSLEAIPHYGRVARIMKRPA